VRALSERLPVDERHPAVEAAAGRLAHKRSVEAAARAEIGGDEQRRGGVARAKGIDERADRGGGPSSPQPPPSFGSQFATAKPAPASTASASMPASRSGCAA
jgi:hypothetical protein